MYPILLACVTALMTCDSPPPVSPPTFFAIGGEVYHAQDRLTVEQQLLRIGNEPRWFKGFPKQVSREEYQAWEKQQGNVNRPELAPGEPVYQIPTQPAYPQSITALLSRDQGATLKLSAKPDGKATTEELVLTITLAAGERAIQREIEHRSTNVLPFLFAFTADGKPVSHESQGGKQNGGTNKFIELVPAKSQESWSVRVAMKSLDELLPAGAKDISLVAVFSERQHEYHDQQGGPTAIEEVWSNDALRKLPPQIVVRSNEVRLRKAGTKWTVERE